MSETPSVSVAEAARRLGVTERTIWRRLRSGARRGRKVDRRILVDLPADRRVSEPARRYALDVPAPDRWSPGPWPYTEEVLERHRRALAARRRAAAEVMDRLAADSRPDPDGLTVVDYLRADRDGIELPDATRHRRQ